METYNIERVVHEPVGLTDGGHLILKCSNCDKNLVDIWITQPLANFEWEAEASCCFCGDKSFKKKFKGRFTYAGFSKEICDGDDFHNYTKVLTPSFKDNQLHFTTVKGDQQ